MIQTNVLASLMKRTIAPISKYASHGRRMFVLPIFAVALTACQAETDAVNNLADALTELGQNITETDQTATETDQTTPETDQTTTIVDTAVGTTISGSVGDGPITQAVITVTDNTGAVLGAAISDVTASYKVTVPADSAYPILITATGGIDVVTGAEPDFTLLSVATDASETTVNINPFSTLIVKTAQAMPGGLISGNLSVAKGNVLDQLNFGLDPLIVPDPITTPINETNVAAIIKSSEAFGEVIRRTRSTLLVSGASFTGNDIIDTIAADMTDGVMDGLGGPGTNLQVSATANVVSAQVLVEALVNRLNVNGTDATTLMDIAINLSVPSATMSTADVIITDGILNQARTATAAAQTRSPSPGLSAVAVILAGLSGNSVASNIDAALPVDPGSAFNEVITQLPLSTNNQLESINTTVKSGAFQFDAPAYSVGESDGSVNITIKRIGGSVGEATVQWRTITFNGNGTADFANDFGTFLWADRTLTFADGETSKVEQITINQDTVVEGDETFSAFLRSPTGDVVSTTVVTIADDDIEPVVVVEPEPVIEPVVAVEPVVVPSDSQWEDLVNPVDLVGFGNKTTGGKGGDICLVTNLNNSGNGSLRDCATRSTPQWIQFDVSGIINLSTIIYPTSNKTFDGRGADITIRGNGFLLVDVSNVIFHNIKIDRPEKDGIRMKGSRTRNVWIDHVTLSNAGDENIDVSSAATDITISWCKFQGTGYAILMSSSAASTADTVMRATVHHNHYEQTGDRLPFVRHGKFHIFNNFIDGYRGSAVEARTNAQLLSENNIWKSSGTSRNNLGINSSPSRFDPLPAASVVSKGEWLIDDLVFQTRNEQDIFNPTDWYEYDYALDGANSTLMSDVVDNSGWH